MPSGLLETPIEDTYLHPGEIAWILSKVFVVGQVAGGILISPKAQQRYQDLVADVSCKMIEG